MTLARGEHSATNGKPGQPGRQANPVPITGNFGVTVQNGGVVQLTQIPAGTTLSNQTSDSFFPMPVANSDLLDGMFGTTQGSIIYRSATAWVALPPGASGDILETLGASANPQWNTLSNLIDLIGATQGAILYRDSGGWVILSPGTSGNVLTTQGAGANPHWAPVTSAGTVTSVGLVLPVSIFSVSGSPVTTSGTLTGTLINQSANQVFSGPTSGAATTPGFRSLVSDDLPVGSASQIGGVKVDNTTITASLGVITASALRIVGSLDGVYTNGQVVMNIPMKNGDTLPASLTGSLLYCTVAPTANATVTLSKISSGTPASIATGSILAGATVGSWTAASSTSFSETTDDTLELTMPGTADTTLAGVGWLLMGTRTQ